MEHLRVKLTMVNLVIKLNKEMKIILYFVLIGVLLSCNAKKEMLVTNSISENNNLTEIESNIINDFLDIELKDDRYKSYKDYEIVIIEEAYKKFKPLYTYEYAYKDLYKHGKEIKNYWILDSLQIEKMKENIKFENTFHWKISDFKNIKVRLYKHEELRRIINSNEYINLPKRLIIYLSRPLIIDNNKALVSFDVGNGQLGFNSITHFTVLMNKEEEKWIKGGYYDDGIYY